MTTRLDICTRECEFGESDGVGHVACELRCDGRGHVVPCLLKAALADPAATCPHSDPAFAKRWNLAATSVVGHCPEGDQLLKARSPICLRCPHRRAGLFCSLAGGVVNLRDPKFACPDHRFAAAGGAA